MEPTTMDRPQGGVAASSPASPASAPAPQAQALVSTKDALFGKRVRKFTRVEVPDYGTCRVTSLSHGQWEDLNTKHEKDGKTDTSHGYMSDAIAATLVEEDGSYVFEDWEAGGQEVRSLPLPVVTKLFAAVATSSGLTVEARDALGKISEPTPSGGGPSSSA